MQSGRRLRGRPSVRQAYPLELVRELAARHGFHPDKAKELRDELQFAAEVGLSWGEIRRERTRLGPERKRKARRHKRIVRRLGQLLDEAVADPDAMKSLLFEIEWRASERSIDLHLPSWKKIEATLRGAFLVIDVIGKEHKDRRSGEQRGTKGNLELNMFACLVARYYDENVKRFTLDYHQQEALTCSFGFLRDAARPVFNASDTQLITAARHAIAELGAHRKKNNST